MFALLWMHSCLVSPMAFLRGHVGRRRTHSTMALVLCVVCASPPGVGVDRRRVCPHRRDVGSWSTAGVNGRDRLGHNGPARLCVCGNRCRRAHNGYPSGSGEVGDDCSVWCICVVAVFGLCDRRVGTAWRHTPVIHDGPDRRPNRNAFYSHWFIANFALLVWQGDTLMAAEPLSWVSCLTSCCHCRGA